MPVFQYWARNRGGDAVEGVVEAGSAEAVADQLMNSGVTPVHIREWSAPNSALAELKELLGGNKPKLDDVLLLCRQMCALTKSGVPLIRGITGLAETSRNGAMAETLRRIRTELESGRDLSSAMAHHPAVFSPLMIGMVRVGENTGRLDKAFSQLAHYLELDRDTRARMKLALRYPMFVLIAVAVAIPVVNIFVIPLFADVFRGLHAELPWQTRLLIFVSDFFVASWPLLLAGSMGGLVAARAYLRTEAGHYRWDKLKLQLPFAGDIILRATLARFARSFATTIASGVPLIQALTVVARTVDNEYVAERILAMRTGVERGDSLVHTARATGLFTPLVVQMIAVGEETGAVDTMLTEVAGFYEREVDYDVKHLGNAIEPLLIVTVGFLVLILALGVFLPLWDLGTVAGAR